MPKTIAITPSWYWPTGVARLLGVPPYSLPHLLVTVPARDRAGQVAIVSGRTELTTTDLQARVHGAARALRNSTQPGAKVVLPGDNSLETVVTLLGALAAGLHVRISPPGANTAAIASEFGAATVLEPGQVASGEPDGVTPLLGRIDLHAPAVTLGGRDWPVAHSHRSLLAAAVSMAAFLQSSRGRPWVSTLPLSRWEGLLSVLVPLYAGAPLVLAPQGSSLETRVDLIRSAGAGYVFWDLDDAHEATREAKKQVKDARGTLAAFLVSVDGMFDPDARRRVSKSFECPALTVWGLPECGPVFASHPSWYLDESVGIPVTNAHVVPADPRTGTPIQALWELVESAEVTVRTPALMVEPGVEDIPERFAGGRYRTGMMASSDPNGMIYLLS
ncbi:MAG: AMP-binding protein [Chloroflexi bacterium]|nr:AMP-binding protein [Chloroflexota bacterium]